MSTASRQALVVLGMHRSGTSALSGVVTLLGARTPQHLMPANPANPKGYWESLLFMKFHDELLQAAGSAWDDWLPIPEGWFDSPAADAFRREIPGLIDDEYADAGLILFKDPRVCRLMPLWAPALREQDIEPLVAFTVRNPVEVAESLRARDGFDMRRGLLLWLRHVLDAEYDSRSLRRSFVSYDDLLANWRSQIDRLSTELIVDWPRSPDDAAEEIDDLLDGSLRHHKSTPAMPRDANDLLSSWIVDASDAFDTLCRPGADIDQPLATLDRVREEFEKATAVFRDAVRDEVHQIRTSVAEARAELQQANTALEAERKMVTTARDQEAATHAELEAEREIAAGQAGRLRDLESKLVVMHRQTEERVEELAKLTRRMLSAEARVRRLEASKKRQIAGLEARTARRHAQIVELKEELVAMQESTSWRMTAPLRSLSGRARGVLSVATKPARRG